MSRERTQAAATEPPAPLIEPGLARGSRLVDPRADELVTLSIPDSKIEVRVTKSNYQKLAQ